MITIASQIFQIVYHSNSFKAPMFYPILTRMKQTWRSPVANGHSFVIIELREGVVGAVLFAFQVNMVARRRVRLAWMK